MLGSTEMEIDDEFYGLRWSSSMYSSYIGGEDSQEVEIDYSCWLSTNFERIIKMVSRWSM